MDIFNIVPVQFQQNTVNISAVSVSNDQLIIAFKSGKLFRIDLNNPSVIQTLELPFKRSFSQELGKIDKLFQDPTGNHLLLSTSKNENFYIHKQSTTFKYLNDLKNSKITVVAWNSKATTQSNTGSFLLGDNNGSIHEAFLEYTESSSKYLKKVNKSIYQSRSNSAIDGLSLEYNEQSDSLIITVISGDDIGYWNFKDIRNTNVKYNELFLNNFFKSTSPIELEKYQDLGKINGEKFTFGIQDSSLCWLTAAGVVYGQIRASKIEKKSNISDLKFIVNLEFPQSTHKFKAVSLTKYHIILLRGQEILIINKLNDELVFNQALPLDEDERLIGLSTDYTSNTYWLYSNLNLYEITVDNEEKDIWKALLRVNEFEKALELTNKTEAKDLIYTKKADYEFSLGNYKDSAKDYALSSQSFETVALRFLDINQTDSLLEYFLSKFIYLKNDKTFKFEMQLVMLSSWVIELFINKLNEIDDALSTEQQDKLQETTLLKTTIEKRFQDFIFENKSILDTATIYEIITSHNRRSELLYYANLIEDYDFVVAYWVRLESWKEALQILEKNSSNHIMLYKYSSVLLVNSPSLTVDTWLRIPGLDAAKLLPAILTYNNNAKKVDVSRHQGIRYLSGYIKANKSKDPKIHDSLLYLLISNESELNEDIILRYLEESGSQFCYNADFILRLCLRFNKIKSAASIYSNLTFYEDAVNLTLKNNMIELAMNIAERPNDDVLRKFLWLKIAEKRISELSAGDNEKIREEVKYLLSRCGDLLSFKDILPYLPDFVTIDNLKDEICLDLEKFSSVINKLSLEMNSTISINENILSDIQQIEQKSNNQYQLIESGESCSICSFLLTTRKFFMFPCSHAFHSDCLIKSIQKSNDYATKKKLDFLQKKFIQSSNGKNGLKFINDQEVDELLSKRCPLCSDIRIETIDQEFDGGSTNEDWSI